MKIRMIGPADSSFAAMKDELCAAGQPTADLLEGDARYFAFEPFGFGGFVAFGDHALLRSIVVSEDARGNGRGSAILNTLLAESRKARCKEAWLLTTDAGEFFARHGFASMPRAQAPAVIAQTKQFKELCPQSAELMCLDLLG